MEVDSLMDMSAKVCRGCHWVTKSLACGSHLSRGNGVASFRVFLVNASWSAYIDFRHDNDNSNIFQPKYLSLDRWLLNV